MLRYYYVTSICYAIIMLHRYVTLLLCYIDMLGCYYVTSICYANIMLHRYILVHYYIIFFKGMFLSYNATSVDVGKNVTITSQQTSISMFYNISLKTFELLFLY